MEIKYLGTGAAEGWPAVFCQCEACRAARRLGGKNIRRRSSALVNGNLLLDLPPDIYGMSLLHGVDLSEIKDFVITHNHSDHFYAHELTNFTNPFGHNADGIPARLFGSATVMEAAKAALADSDEEGRPELTEAREYEPFIAAGCTVTPLPAAHNAGICFIYLIESCGKAMLYAHDTGWLPAATWEYLQGRRLDFVSMDGTCLDYQHYESHMTLDENIAMKQKLVSMGGADDKTAFVSAHFSHNGRLLHDQIVERLKPHGIAAAYDGMEMEF